MLRVALHTLGCKVNQYETRRIAEDFRASGFELVKFSDEADVYVINTCTVTGVADGKSRQAARTAIRRNPGAMVVLTGCTVETARDQLEGIEGIGLILGNSDKDRLVEHVLSRLAVSPASHSALRTSHLEFGRTRALLKIQDGCDQFCAYCAVPLARPVMSSRPFAEAVSEASDLAHRGYKEIVLTGIRLGRYDHGLSDLIRAVSDIQGIERIRLSSIELTDMPDDLLDLMSRDRKICRHLHVPLQSGDDTVLARMRRPYTTSDFESFVARARELVPGIGVTSDVIVGFPGETEEQFERTYRFVERMRFSRLHVFPFSRRPGTAAHAMQDDVTPADKSRRKARMIRLGESCADRFATRLIGETVSVLVESRGKSPNVRLGLTDNYVRVAVRDGRCATGDIVPVRVESVSRGEAQGALVQ